jgi:hypothetical protein
VESSPIARLSSAALGLGGIAGAAFVIVSRGEVMGAIAMLSPRWLVAHNLHFISAMLLLFGVVGLYQAHSHRMTAAGHFAFVMALLGTGLFLAGGVITAALLPFIAGSAPYVVSPGGPLFHPLLPILPISLGLFSFGWFLLGIVIARRGLYPAWTGWTLAAGVAVQAIPPRPFGPVPWIMTDTGWVIMAIGLIGIAVHGWQSASPARAIQGEPGLASGD